MNWKEFFGLDAKKILVIISLLALTSVPGFLPALTDPQSCYSVSCTLYIGMPAAYLNIKMGGTGGFTPIFTFTGLAINIITFYLITGILFYLFRRKKNVPDINSGG